LLLHDQILVFSSNNKEEEDMTMDTARVDTAQVDTAQVDTAQAVVSVQEVMSLVVVVGLLSPAVLCFKE
jgi:hypothetical protein